jgi:hypothetical protein
MYKVYAIHHSTQLPMYEYLLRVKAEAENTVDMIIDDESNAVFQRYLGGGRTPAFIMCKDDIPYTRLIGKYSTPEVLAWIRKSFD